MNKIKHKYKFLYKIQKMVSNTNSLIIFNEKYNINDKMRLDVSPKYRNFNTGSPYFIILFTNITDYNINIEVYDDKNTKTETLSMNRSEFIEDINELIDKNEYEAAEGCDIYCLPPVKIT